MFFVFGYLPERLFSSESDRLRVVSMCMKLADVSNNICFFFSKTLFRNLSLNHFSNLGNICLPAVCSGVLQEEGEISLVDHRVQIGFRLVFDGIAGSPCLSVFLFTSHSSF